jgi:SpoVK/Ycf46/Vps4 family AAA+-type ATPase
VSGTSTVLDARSLPDEDVRLRYEALVGIDSIKQDLLRALRVAMHPQPFERWAAGQKDMKGAAALVLDRPQLFVLAGDVGTGKTELAQTIGDSVARAERAAVTLHSLSLAARGTGLVGEMTQLIVAAFREVQTWGEKRKGTGGKPASGILFIDEADAIGQSRESDQMHHEDRAGVNALIRGIDDLARARVPVAVLMATNRVEALDPAILRRAALIVRFTRPNDTQRAALLTRLLPAAVLGATGLTQLVRATGPRRTGEPGYTYSDLTQRLIPLAMLEAFSGSVPLSLAALLDAATRTEPTPTFGASTSRSTADVA